MPSIVFLSSDGWGFEGRGFRSYSHALSFINNRTLQITLKDGSYGSIGSAVTPVLKLSGEKDDLEYGVSVDLASDGLPKSIWGQKSTSSKGWNLKTRAEYTEGKYDFDGEDSGAYLTVQGNDDDEETFLWGSATVSTGNVKGLKAGMKKIINKDAGKFMVAPRYNFDDASAQIVLGYEKDDTDAYLTLSGDDQDVKIVQTLDDANSASLKIGSSGFISATVTNESDMGTTTVTLTPDELDVEVNNDGWVAGVTCDKDLGSAAPTVRFSKSLTFGA